MAANSKIEWTDATWNPIRARNLKTGKVGWHCEHVTTGCEFCYSEGFNKRLGTALPFKPGHRKDVEIFLDETMLTAPLRWKKPRMIFVCSMTDAFASFVTDEMLDKMFAVMALCPQHTFQVLTKRAERIRRYLDRDRARFDIDAAVIAIREAGHIGLVHQHDSCLRLLQCWPLPNVWLGVSTERQQEADERIPHLLQTPAAVRFISAEPLLGPIDLMMLGKGGDKVTDALQGCIGTSVGDGEYDGARPCAKLDWVIVGGESGPGARRMEARWVRDIHSQCADASVPFFFKQWGAHDPDTFDVVGKKAAGRLLDGKEHNAMPQVSA